MMESILEYDIFLFYIELAEFMQDVLRIRDEYK